jgi:large subunit ribosomal protein L21
MFAVIKTGGKQYRVAAQDMLKIDRLKGEPGEIVQFGEVLLMGGDSVTVGSPTITGASVAAEVLEQGRGPKIIAFKKRRRKNSRRKRGFRAEFTLVRITEILTDGATPTMTASVRRPNRKPEPKVVAAADEAAEEAAPAKRTPKGKSPKGSSAKGSSAKGSSAKGKSKPKAAKKPAKPASRKTKRAKSSSQK